MASGYDALKTLLATQKATPKMNTAKTSTAKTDTSGYTALLDAMRKSKQATAPKKSLLETFRESEQADKAAADAQAAKAPVLKADTLVQRLEKQQIENAGPITPFERAALAAKSGVESAGSGALGAFQTGAQFLGKKASDLFGTEEYLSNPQNREFMEKAAQAGVFGQSYYGGEKSLLNADDLKAASEQSMQKAKQGAGKIGGVALDVIGTGTNMGASAALAAAAGIPYLAGIGTTAGGSAALQAKEQGKTIEQQTAYGLTSGLSEAAIESISGIGASKALKAAAGRGVSSLLSKLPPGVASWLSKAGTSTAAKILGDAVGEATEEAVQYDVDRVLQKITLGNDVPRDIKEQAYQALIGGVTGGIFGGANAVGSTLGKAQTQATTPVQTAAEAAQVQTAPATPAEAQPAQEATPAAPKTIFDLMQEDVQQREQAKQTAAANTAFPDKLSTEEFNNKLDTIADERETLSKERRARGENRRAFDSLEQALVTVNTPLDLNTSIPAIIKLIQSGRADAAALLVERWRRALVAARTAKSGLPPDHPDYPKSVEMLKQVAVDRQANYEQLKRLYDIQIKEQKTPEAQPPITTPAQAQTAPVMPQTQNPVQTPIIAQEQTPQKPVTYTENATESNTAQQGTAQVESSGDVELGAIRDIKDANLKDKIKRDINSKAWEKAFNEMGYKTLSDKETAEKEYQKTGDNLLSAIRAKSDFEILERRYQYEYSHDDSFVKSIIGQYEVKENQKKRNKLVEDSFSKPDWQVPQSIIIERADAPWKNDTIIKEHKQSVLDALNSGENVPSEVLKDYPDLAPQGATQRKWVDVLKPIRKNASQKTVDEARDKAVEVGLQELANDIQSGMSGAELKAKAKAIENEYHVGTQTKITNGRSYTNVESAIISASDALTMFYESAAVNPQGTLSQIRGILSQSNPETAPATPAEAQTAPAATQASTQAQTGDGTGVGAMDNPFTSERKVSEVYTNTLKNTDLLNDVQKAQLDERDYAFDSVSEKESVTKAKQRLDVDFDGEVADLSAMPSYTAAEDVDTAMGILGAFAKDSEAKNDFTSMKQWSKDLYQKIHQSAVTLQAMDKYSRTPEGAVIKAQQAVYNAEQKLTTENVLGKKVKNSIGQKVKADTKSVNDIVDTAESESVDEAVEAVEKGLRDNGVPVELWSMATGDKLADRLTATPQTKPKTIMQTMLNDLMSFADEHALPKHPTTAKRTALDRLRDYFANKQFYTEAWRQAQAQVRETYSDNPEALAKFDEWINSTIEYNADPMHIDKNMLNAILQASDDLGLSKTDIRNYSAIGAKDVVATRIADKFVQALGVDGADAIQVKDAVTRHINEISIEDTAKDRTGNIVRATAKTLKIDIQKLLSRSKASKATAANEIANYLVRQYNISGEAATQVAQTVTTRFYAELEARSKKKLMSILKPRTAAAKKTLLQQLDAMYNLGAFDNESTADLVRSKYGIPTLTAADVQKIYELTKMANETTDDYQKRAYTNRAARVIADKMPVTLKNKVLAVRRIAMLLNPKTVISRNAGGNIVFGMLEDIKDAPGTLIDYIVSKKTGVRTTSYNPVSTTKAELSGMKKGLLEWARDIKEDVDTSPTSHEMPRSTALKSRLGAGVEKALYNLLALGDRPFFEGAYAKRIDEFRRLGLDYTSADAQVEATAYALERVFQNDSALAQKAMQLRESLGILGDIAIPFAQTPANIFDKLADYSPYGFVRAIKKAGSVGDSAWSQKQFVDTLSRSITGTGLIRLGAVLAANGLITGGEKDEEDEAVTYQKKISGWQPYSIVVGDKSYTYDWANPVGTLLALGADIEQSKNAKETLSAIGIAGLKAGINTMFNQSYMEGLSEIFGQDDIASGFETMLIGLPASFTPTAFQQMARIIDPIARDTYDTDPFKRSWNKVKAKLPWASATLPAKVGASGQEMTNFQGGTLSNIFESVLSPGYINKQRSTAIDTEVQRLYTNTKLTAALPNWSEYTSKGDLSFTVDGIKYEMNASEWEKYQKTRGQEAYKTIAAVIARKEYKSLSDAEKAALVTDALEAATHAARRETLKARGKPYPVKDKVFEATTSGFTVDEYLAYMAKINSYGGTSLTQDEVQYVIDNQLKLPKDKASKLWKIINSSWKTNPYK